MEDEDLIIITDCCTHYNIDLSFIYALQDSGLIEIRTVEENLCIPENQLPHLEKLARLYYEMDINLEGIETINHLLQRMKHMQESITALNNRLKLYEEK